MSFTDDADPVRSDQSDEGGESTGTPYDEYLNRIPEEAREAATEAFRAWDANYTRRQQEAAEYRSRWQPFENASTEDLQWGLDMNRAARENPQAVWEWAQQYARDNNLVQSPAPEQPSQELTYEQWAAQQEEQSLNTRLESMLNPIMQRLEQYDQRYQEQEQQRQIQQAQDYLQHQMDGLKREHPDAFQKLGDIEPEQMIETLSGKYIESDPEHAIPRAFAEWQSIISQVSKSYAEGKLNQPSVPESGAAAPAGNEAPKTLAEASSQALEQIRAWHRA